MKGDDPYTVEKSNLQAKDLVNNTEASHALQQPGRHHCCTQTSYTLPMHVNPMNNMPLTPRAMNPENAAQKKVLSSAKVEDSWRNSRELTR